MSPLSAAILSAAQVLPEGGLVAPKEFLHRASRAAVDQALSRLAREGELLRVGRGAYCLPVASRYGSRPPSTEAVVEAIASTHGEVVVPNGAAETKQPSPIRRGVNPRRLEIDCRPPLAHRPVRLCTP